MQGHIWQGGYKSGQLKCTLYPDVLPALQDWTDQHIRTYIYSSGSRLAQRDLFAHTGDGDVRQHLSGYFDTTSGPKVMPVVAALRASWKVVSILIGEGVHSKCYHADQPRKCCLSRPTCPLLRPVHSLQLCWPTGPPAVL